MKALILKMHVNVVSMEEVVNRIDQWVKNKKSRYVCLSNVHMCMETYDDQQFRKVVNNADFVLPDGRPLFWVQKLLGFSKAKQIRGFDLTHRLCELANEKGYNVGFLGGASNVILEKFKLEIIKIYPNIIISFSYSPPFRQLTEEEETTCISDIKNTNVDILFVGLGCPKQEKWMSSHKNILPCTMLGVGAVFDFISGEKKEAPSILSNLGLEWLYRLVEEPKRLWRRYLKQNPRFIYYFLLQLLGLKKHE